MIYSIGIPILSEIKMEPLTDRTKLGRDDILLIDAVGHRCLWDKTTHVEKLKSIIPTKQHVFAIQEFLMRGGKIVSSMVDPHKSQDIFATKEEVAEYNFCLPYQAVEDGICVNISIPPYNWIPNNYSFVPIQAYNIFRSALCTRQTIMKGEYTYVVENHISSFTYHIGKKGGNITFSTIINGSMKQQDVFSLLALKAIKKSER